MRPRTRSTTSTTRTPAGRVIEVRVFPTRDGYGVQTVHVDTGLEGPVVPYLDVDKACDAAWERKRLRDHTAAAQGHPDQVCRVVVDPMLGGAE